MPFPELSFQELYDLRKSCRHLFPEKRFSEIDNDFLESLNTDLLRRTYKKRIFDCHPDRLGAASDSMIRIKTRECQQANEAYERLNRFIQGRNEWIYTVLTSYHRQERRFSNEMCRQENHPDRANIFERFKRHIHPLVNPFRGTFREMPRESMRSV